MRKRTQVKLPEPSGRKEAIARLKREIRWSVEIIPMVESVPSKWSSNYGYPENVLVHKFVNEPLK